MEALAALASSKSKRLPEIARALVKLCEDCVAQCAPHAEKHPVCKACHDACQRTIEVVAKLGRSLGEPVVSAFTVARTLALVSKRETVDSGAS